nr:MAG TPA: hypothetical protein [Caudoviricetes sp.]
MKTHRYPGWDTCTTFRRTAILHSYSKVIFSLLVAYFQGLVQLTKRGRSP